MRSPSRPSKFAAIMAIAAISLLAIAGACSSDDEPTPTAVFDPTQAPGPIAVATSRPTVTPVPQPTSTPEATATPAPTSTPTPTPTATPTPPAPVSRVVEMGRLQTEKGIDFGKQFIASVAAAEWANDSFGCPASGTFYDTTDAPYTGFIYVIGDGSSQWEYHTNQDDTITIRCSEIEPVSGPTVNISQTDGLHDATKLTLMRKDFDTGTFVVRREMTEEDLDRVADIFDLETDLSAAESCNTIFRLDFVTPNGGTEIEVICEEDYARFDIFWEGKQGTAPILGYIIGPYLTGDPIPTLPTATP